MTDYQLEPLRSVELGEKQGQLQVFEKAVLEHKRHSLDEDSSSAPLPVDCPYKQRMCCSVYEKEKQKLQIGLLKVQSWIKDPGQRIVSLLEGHDTAGRGGTIKRFTEHLNPCDTRAVALEKLTTTEHGQWYFQRCIRNLLTAGEMVFFGRS